MIHVLSKANSGNPIQEKEWSDMCVRNLLTLNAIFSFLTAVVLFFSPASIAGVFEVGTTGSVLHLIQLFGGAMVGYGLASWLMRNAGPSEARTAFLKSGGGYVVVSIIASYSLLSGFGSSIIWFAVAFSFLLGAMFLYLGIRSPDAG